MSNCNQSQAMHISINACYRLLCVYTVCTHCIVFFCSLLRISVLFYPTKLFPSFNKAGLLAWVHTCHFFMHLAGWVGLLPHLSFYSLPVELCVLLVGLFIALDCVSLPPLLHRSLLGCVAATLILFNN